MSNRKLKIILAVLFIPMLIVLLCVAEIFQPPDEPHIKIKLVGYTNDLNGKILASLKLENDGNVSMDISPSSTIYWGENQSTPDYKSCALPSGIVIAPGNFQIVSLPKPEVSAPWRTSFGATRHLTSFNKKTRQILYALNLRKRSSDEEFFSFMGPTIEPDTDSNRAIAPNHR